MSFYKRMSFYKEYASARYTRSLILAMASVSQKPRPLNKRFGPSQRTSIASSRLLEDFRILTLEALRNAWPCKMKNP